MTIDQRNDDVSKLKQRSAVGKISFVGCPAVGKTTLVKLLSQKLINGRYIPTQGFDLGMVSFNGLR